MCAWVSSEQLSSDISLTGQRQMLAAEFVWLHVGKGWSQEVFRGVSGGREGRPFLPGHNAIREPILMAQAVMCLPHLHGNLN